MQTIDFFDNTNKYFTDVNTHVATLKVMECDELRFEDEVPSLGQLGTIVSSNCHIELQILTLICQQCL
jgi:hypothetical protein